MSELLIWAAIYAYLCYTPALMQRAAVAVHDWAAAAEGR